MNKTFNHSGKLIGKFCPEPFRTISIDPTGYITMCGCPEWQPTQVGNIFNTPVTEILSSPLAKEIRDSIRDGSFKFCDPNSCGMIVNDKLLNVDDLQNQTSPEWLAYSDESTLNIPSTYFIAGDPTCNLSCPSCRTRVIKQDYNQLDNNSKIIDKFNLNLFANNKTDQIIDIRLSTSGEVFASPLLMDFLRNYPIDSYPNTEFWLQTNGLLLKSRWKHLQHIENNIKTVTVTADSSKKNTYEILRRGGRFENLIENLEYIQELKVTLDFKFILRMVVQYNNYLEIKEFYHWSKSLGADSIEYLRLKDWGTYPTSKFSELDVLDPAHELYTTVSSSIRNLKQQYADIEIFGFNL